VETEKEKMIVAIYLKKGPALVVVLSYE